VRPLLGEVRRYRTREHDGLGSAWRAFRRDIGEDLPRCASFALAGPVGEGVVRFVNSDWTIDPAGLGRELGIDRFVLLNDFGAVARAVAVLEPGELEPICGPPGPIPAGDTVSVMGPGTGLGVAILLRRGGRSEVVETEGSHIGFAPLNEDEQRMADALRRLYGRASVERLVSGPALIDLYRNNGGGEWDVGDAGGLWSAALDGRDPIAAEALDQLVKCFGSVAGDLALAHGAGSVAISGGLSRRMAERLRSPLFAGRFVAKGRYRARMEAVRVRLVTHPEPGLLGAALAFEEKYTLLRLAEDSGQSDGGERGERE